ncbi:unnamed protein product [Vicia faba]|uniref:Nodule-specific Glycine Rich Peptide n=1 Tax=Vicia faba TaxID=3906 RepID=A0AAV0YK56_VICFA|nr:unnamed protein product [Vicia faba]
MKFKPFIFMFFPCAIVFLSVVAISPLKSGAIEESKTKIWIDRNEGLGRGHSDDIDWVGSGTWGGWGRPGREGRKGRKGGSEEVANKGGNERHDVGFENGDREEYP